MLTYLYKIYENNTVKEELNEDKELKDILGESFRGIESPVIEIDETLHLAEAIHSSDLIDSIKLRLFNSDFPKLAKEVNKRLNDYALSSEKVMVTELRQA